MCTINTYIPCSSGPSQELNVEDNSVIAEEVGGAWELFFVLPSLVLALVSRVDSEAIVCNTFLTNLFCK